MNSLFLVGLSEMNEVSIIDGTCKVLFLDEQHDLVEFPTMEMTMCHSYMEYEIKKKTSRVVLYTFDVSDT